MWYAVVVCVLVVVFCSWAVKGSFRTEHLIPGEIDDYIDRLETMLGALSLAALVAGSVLAVFAYFG